MSFTLVCTQPEDFNRTIGVGVDYIDTADYNMVDEDRAFLKHVSIIQNVGNCLVSEFV